MLRSTAVVATAAGLALAGDRWVTPRPALLALRDRFDPATAATADRMRSHLAGAPIVHTDVTLPGLSTGAGTDVVRPVDGGRCPVVVWIHGGGWFSGHRSDVLPYLELLAEHGFAGLAPDYPLAPKHRYPTALHHLARTLSGLVEAADQFGIDADRIVLAGDSVGAQLAAQLAVAVTDPAYAEELCLDLPVRPVQLRGVALCCGIYDLPALRRCERFFGAVMHRATWGYTGARRWEVSPAATQASTLRHVTTAFPPTLLISGPADPLTAHQTRPFGARLRELDVEVDEFLAEEPAAGHEFQFALDTAAAQQALGRLIAFLQRTTAP